LQTLNSITKKIERERSFTNMRATALAISDDLLFIGNSEGQVWMFDAKSEEEYDTFSDKSKEFLGNSVTAIDVHALRSEYIVLGYEKGQLVLFDATEPKKSIKSIKDHHNA
jgi:outer membrane protein assembly factor BamB